MRVKTLSKEEGEKIGIDRFPNFDKSGSVSGMKKMYYGKDALLVRCGSYIYNVTSEPEIYHNNAYAQGGVVGSIKSIAPHIKNIERLVDFSIRGNSYQIPYDGNMVNDHHYYLNDKEFLEKYHEKIGCAMPDDDEFDDNGQMEEFRQTEQYIITFKDDSELTLDFDLHDSYLQEVYVRDDEPKDSMAVKYAPQFEKDGWDMDIGSLYEEVTGKTAYAHGGTVDGCDSIFHCLFGFH